MDQQGWGEGVTPEQKLMQSVLRGLNKVTQGNPNPKYKTYLKQSKYDSRLSSSQVKHTCIKKMMQVVHYERYGMFVRRQMGQQAAEC